MTLTSRVLAGRYRLLETIGQGGMAVVYRAHDLLLDRDVAVKVLRTGYAEDPVFVERFRREARHAASLHHPNIVTVHDTGVDPETKTEFIVMQLVEGPDLRWVLDRQRVLPVGFAVRIGIEAAHALAYAHDHAVVHRDIKPANILVDADGDVRVADFGIARVLSDAGATTSGTMLGSAPYASPEQVLGARVGPRSDLYSLGVVLYECLTGVRPFDGPSPAAVALERLRVTPRGIRSIDPALPERLERIVTRLLARAPDQRTASAGDLAVELERFRTEALGGVRRSGGRARDRSARIRSRRAEGAVAAGAVGAALDGAWTAPDDWRGNGLDDATTDWRGDPVEGIGAAGAGAAGAGAAGAGAAGAGAAGAGAVGVTRPPSPPPGPETPDAADAPAREDIRFAATATSRSDAAPGAIDVPTVGVASAAVPSPTSGEAPTQRRGRRAVPGIDRQLSRRVAALAVLLIATFGVMAVNGGDPTGGVLGTTSGSDDPGDIAVLGPSTEPGSTPDPSLPAIFLPPVASPFIQSPTVAPTPSPTATATAAPVRTAAPTPRPTPRATPKPTPRPTPRPTTRPTQAAPPAPASERDPAETVARFYALVVRHDYAAAARLWSPAMRDRYPPDRYIDGRFDATTAIDVNRMQITRQGRTTAVVAIDIIEHRSSGSSRHWFGSWDLVKIDGVWLMNDPDLAGG